MTRRAYESRSVVEATPRQVWDVLTDAAEYARWPNGVVRVEGVVGPGERITVYSEVDPRRSFPVTVTEFTPCARLVWRGGMPLGLFSGVRTFTLRPTPRGDTEFTMREEYTGPLAPVLWRVMPNLGPSFAKFATGLRDRFAPPAPAPGPDELRLS